MFIGTFHFLSTHSLWKVQFRLAPFPQFRFQHLSSYSKIRIRHPEFVIIHRFQPLPIEQEQPTVEQSCPQNFRGVAQESTSSGYRIEWLSKFALCRWIKTRGKLPQKGQGPGANSIPRDAGSGISNTTAITRFNIYSNRFIMLKAQHSSTEATYRRTVTNHAVIICPNTMHPLGISHSRALQTWT